MIIHAWTVPSTAVLVTSVNHLSKDSRVVELNIRYVLIPQLTSPPRSHQIYWPPNSHHLNL